MKGFLNKVQSRVTGGATTNNSANSTVQTTANPLNSASQTAGANIGAVKSSTIPSAEGKVNQNTVTISGLLVDGQTVTPSAMIPASGLPRAENIVPRADITLPKIKEKK